MPVGSLQVTQGSGTGVAFRGILPAGTINAQAVDTAPWPETPIVGAQRLVVGTAWMGTATFGTGGTISIPVGNYGTATHAYISVENDAGIRFWNTGDTPTSGTAGLGHFLSNGAGPLELSNLGLLRIVTGDSASLGTFQLSYHTYP